MIHQLQYEADHFDIIPERLKYHAAARWKLRCDHVYVRGDLREKRSIEREYIQVAHSLKLEVIVDRLQKPCWINKKVHSCLDGFRADPKIVLTWQVLWRWPVGHADGTHR